MHLSTHKSVHLLLLFFFHFTFMNYKIILSNNIFSLLICSHVNKTVSFLGNTVSTHFLQWSNAAPPNNYHNKLTLLKEEKIPVFVRTNLARKWFFSRISLDCDQSQTYVNIVLMQRIWWKSTNNLMLWFLLRYTHFHPIYALPVCQTRSLFIVEGCRTGIQRCLVNLWVESLFQCYIRQCFGCSVPVNYIAFHVCSLVPLIMLLICCTW